MKQLLKFLAKNFVPLIGGAMLFLFGARPPKEGRDKRVLVMFGGGIGDVVKRSVVCEYVKKYLSAYEVTYLMPYDLELPHAAHTIHFRYKRAKMSPWYYFSITNRLRKIGFGRAIVLLPAWEGFYVSLGAAIRPDTLYRYAEAVPPEAVGEASSFFARFRARAKNVRDVDLISFYDPRWKEEYYPSDPYRMAYLFSKMICDMMPERAHDLDEKGLLKADLKTEIVPSIADARPKEVSGAYAAIGLGSSYAGKDWPAEKYGAVAKHLHEKGFAIVLVGGSECTPLIPAFEAAYGGPYVNTTSSTSLPDLVSILEGAAFVVGNDTSIVHIGVALRKPVVCVCYGRQIGADSCYGYEGINQWVFGEDFKGIPAATVIEKVDSVLAAQEKEKSGAMAPFTTSFFDNDYPKKLGAS